MSEDRPATRHEQAYNALRADILAGRLLPGTRLRFAELCARYGVSVGSLREALSRLVEQGLVQSAPQQGFSVTSISKADLMNLTLARREIETLTLRHAIESGDVAWEADLLAAEHRLAAVPIRDANDPARFSEEWAEAHSRLHQTLLAGCANPHLTAVATQLRDAAELYRRWSLPLGHGERRDIVREHREIVDAAVRRDVELAVARLDRHISLTTELLLSAELDVDSPAGPK